MKLWCYKRKAQFLIDKEDFEKIQGYNWTLHSAGYINAKDIFSKDYKKVLLHHLIMPKKEGYCIDHINGNRLDNRKSNLRYATAKENTWNTAKKSNATQSKHRGVYKNSTKSKPWKAQIQHKHLGTFKTELEAAIAYKEEANKRYGKFASQRVTL
jgi:hypothetical protein